MIDTHLHIWDPNIIEYGWLSTAPSILNKTYRLCDIKSTLDSLGIKKVILVQAANSIDETKFLLNEASKVNWVAGVVGWVNLLSPSSVRTQIADYQNIYLKGIRHLINIESNENWILQKNVLVSLKIIEEHNLSFEFVGTSYNHLACIEKIATQFPNLRIIIDHLNQPPLNFSESLNWRRQALKLADYSNIYFKFSGLGTVGNRKNNWSWTDISQWTNFFLENHNNNRILLGCDWPICELNSNYKSCFNQYLKCIENCDEKTFKDITYRNALSAYNLEIDEI